MTQNIFTSPFQGTIAVIGLGYVGLPLAVHLAKHFPTIGFDISKNRIEELNQGFDRTGEIEESQLKASTLKVTDQTNAIEGVQVYIVTVPTPVNDHNEPDLTPLDKASATVGKLLKKGDVVVFESTVYPGVTEDFCGPLLEKYSGLKSGVDFFLGYSPERINPGDKVHTVDKITKIVSGQTPQTTQLLKEIYGAVNGGQIFCAATIQTAEAAKVIENAQRDINIAFMNEIAGIFQKMGIGVYDVLDAASTKWNFLPFKPGLVGGHCIGVDPYYLAKCAQKVGHEPEIILAGRRINEGMSGLMAKAIDDRLKGLDKAPILVLGLTFKEDVPDLRNTKVIDLIQSLEALGHEVHVHDPCCDPKEAKDFYGIDLKTSWDDLQGYGCVIGAVPHKDYQELTASCLLKLLTPTGFVADLKGLWRGLSFPQSQSYWGF